MMTSGSLTACKDTPQKRVRGRSAKDSPALYNSRSNWEMVVILWLWRLRQGNQEYKVCTESVMPAWVI